MTDLLAGLLDGAYEGQLLVDNGQTAGGWHVYASSRGGVWVADELKTPQTDHMLHLRTGPTYPHWHRSYFTTHFVRPEVHCSFRIDGHDSSRSGLGFKLQYLHQGNNTSGYVRLFVDGRVDVYREARDGDVDGPGVRLASGRWTHRPSVRRHLRVVQDESGTLTVWVDGDLTVSARLPYQNGQIGLRLDGLDCRIFSLVVNGDAVTELDGLTQVSPALWHARRDYDVWPATPKDGVTVHYVDSKPTQGYLLAAGHERCDDMLIGIERYHMASKPNGNGWSGIGYNFMVCPHGVLFRGRGEARGAHNPADSDVDGTPDNVDSYGVLMLVGGDEQPSVAALSTLADVCDAVGGWVAPHSAARATSCPGDPLRTWVDRYVDDTEDDVAVADWAKKAWAWGKSIGLVKSSTKPGDTMTKQEFVVLLKRYHDATR